MSVGRTASATGMGKLKWMKEFRGVTLRKSSQASAGMSTASSPGEVGTVHSRVGDMVVTRDR